MSFVGRAFPLEEADEHLARLRSWGLTFLRLLVPAEAVGHAGTGAYEFEYLDYFREVVCRAGKHGLHLFIDPHQDACYRGTGQVEFWHNQRIAVARSQGIENEESDPLTGI